MKRPAWQRAAFRDAPVTRHHLPFVFSILRRLNQGIDSRQGQEVFISVLWCIHRRFQRVTRVLSSAVERAGLRS